MIKIIDKNHRAFKNYESMWRFDWPAATPTLDWDRLEGLIDQIMKTISELWETERLKGYAKTQKQRSNGRHYLTRIYSASDDSLCFILYTRR
jgi:hypothetical protein